jgi:hypothetical protein
MSWVTDYSSSQCFFAATLRKEVANIPEMLIYSHQTALCAIANNSTSHKQYNEKLSYQELLKR